MTKPRPRQVVVNGKSFIVEASHLSGLQIRTIAGLQPGHHLVAEGSGKVPDRVISDTDQIELVGPITHIYSRPDTRFG
jgi:hypothetical protein